MKFTGKIIQVKSDSVRLVCERCRLDGSGIKCKPPQQIQFRGVSQPLKRGFFKEGCPGTLLKWKVGDHLPGIAEHGMSPGVSVLDIKHRIVLGLLDDLGE